MPNSMVDAMNMYLGINPKDENLQEAEDLLFPNKYHTHKIMMNRIYISGPMSGMPDKNQDAFLKAEQHYAHTTGMDIINPYRIGLTLFGFYEELKIDSPTYLEYLCYNLPNITICCMLIVLPGWEDSFGSIVEIQQAFKYNIPVFEAYSDKQVLPNDERFLNKAHRFYMSVSSLGKKYVMTNHSKSEIIWIPETDKHNSKIETFSTAYIKNTSEQLSEITFLKYAQAKLKVIKS